MGRNKISRINIALNKHVFEIGVIFTVFVFILPFGYGLDLGPGPNNLRALIWEYMNAPWFSGYRIVPISTFLSSLLYTFPRFILLYFVIRYCIRKTTKKVIIITGIINELFPMLVSGLRIIGWLLGWTQPPPPISDHWFPIYISIPLLLLFIFVLVIITPSEENDKVQS